MESHPISSRAPDVRVRGAGESSGRDRDPKGNEQRREAFRKAREKAAVSPVTSEGEATPTKPSVPAKRSAPDKPAADETDARGRKLDIRV